MGLVNTYIPLPMHLTFLLLAQKRAKRSFEPALCAVTKEKGYPVSLRDPMLPRARPARPSLGKEAYALYFSG